MVLSCSICCENINKSSHKKIPCNYCDIQVCAACVEKYLLTTSKDAHCMNCNNGWTTEILHNSLTKKFLTSSYKERRELLLFDREKSLLPATQYLAEQRKIVYDIQKELEPLYKSKKDTAKKIVEASNYYYNSGKMIHWRVKVDFDIELSRINHEIKFLEFKRMNVNRTAGLGLTEAKKEKREFVRGCPADNCKGFLSSGWKCGMCEVRVCSDCHEIKETKEQYDLRKNKDNAGSSTTELAQPHVCKDENVQTAKLLAQDTRACPKCASMIFKIEGCDQMWCTQCQTGFSWKSGEIANGALHNPHYYEWLRQQNNGAIPRQPGDVPCGGMPEMYNIQQICRMPKVNAPKEFINELSLIHRLCAHIQFVEIPRYRVNRYDVNQELRIRYLLNDITEDCFKKTLQKNEKATHKKNEIRMILDMMVGVAADIYRNMLQARTLGEITQRRDELDGLRKYTNKSFEPISTRYACVVPFISSKWTYSTIKY